MNKSVKAALLSGLIFPGVGQISIGHKKRGWFIIGMNVIFIYLIISEIIEQAYSVIAKMQQSGAAMDIESISKTTSGMVSFSDNMFLNILFIMLIVGWFASIIDAYRLGKIET